MNATTSKGKLLLIDDDEMNGMLLKKRLNKRGFECEYVQSADECFEVLNQQQFDLVLLDIIMPRVSGIDVLVQIRKQKNNFELPVIMVTAKDEASDVVEALKKGANDYITKPVNMEIAEARIKTQLKIKTLIHESLHLNKINTINTMVTTLNHEINNPLAIAIGNLSLGKANIDETRIEKALNALNRITQIVKKIEKITSGEEIEEVNYSETVNMYKL
ncbi:MAG: response regulator [Bacteriovoracaceae bacterium]|jgi:DNA-binding response OmpR family regulator|nr:response regulator [Bacteriovoracaceae bacterium]